VPRVQINGIDAIDDRPFPEHPELMSLLRDAPDANEPERF
jgi:hypothetical protein